MNESEKKYLQHIEEENIKEENITKKENKYKI